MSVKKYLQYEKVIFSIAFIICIALLIWKIPYGWGAYDEPYYISVPYRIIMGDGYIADEWNLAQFSSFILLPAVWLYHMIVPSMDGVVIAFRILYVTVQIIWTLVMMHLLKPYGNAGRMAALVYLLFVPLNIMAFSYDSMGLGLMMMISVIMVSESGNRKSCIFICGILFSLAVLCNPSLCILYFLYFLLSAVLCLSGREHGIFDREHLLFSFAGVMTAAFIFLSFLLSRASFNDIITGIPHMLNDQTHGAKGMADIIMVPIIRIYDYYSPWCFIWLIVILLILFDKKRSEHVLIYFAVQSLSVLCSLAGYVLTVRTNCFMLPFSVIGLTAFLLCRRKPAKIFRYMWLWGVLYAICMHIVSDQDIYVIAMALTISDAASVIILVQFIREQCGRVNIFRLLCSVLIAAQLMTEGVSLSRNTYWESTRTETLDTFITEGPLKGIRTTPDKVETYNKILGDISDCRDMKDKKIAFMTQNTWEYLYAGQQYGTYSPWLGHINNDTINKFMDYCTLHPEKVPDYIYFSKLEEEQCDSSQIKRIKDAYGYSETESDISIKLQK